MQLCVPIARSRYFPNVHQQVGNVAKGSDATALPIRPSQQAFSSSSISAIDSPAKPAGQTRRCYSGREIANDTLACPHHISECTPI
ncbi:hypothetical protein Bxe_A0860 [Paraburkholderia xenovorans LB400]|uniref:Uncharacterized protein n=1 Tax=Paraburkholderia xenovorans (strain LB400) TaxID=266265 RepID=Q13V15_PARXL|nr:hypothetical protein Bxe_A0860 [Paraburkholderia xenovorans LB400]